MIINCVWEHNGSDTLLYAVDYIGAWRAFPWHQQTYAQWFLSAACTSAYRTLCTRRHPSIPRSPSKYSASLS